MTYEPALPLWQHQTRALDLSRDREYFAFLMEMGTGKTKVAIDEFCDLYERGKIDRALVMAPKGVYMNWIRTELPTHIPSRLRDELIIRHWGSKREDLDHLLGDVPALRILVMNTEAVSFGRKAMDFAEAFLRRGRGAYMALDESTFIKNPVANRTKNAVALGRMCSYRRIMSGLPVPRGPLDMFSQADFLRAGLLGQSFFAFRARYAILKDMRFGGRRVTTVVGYRNIEELTERVSAWSYRVTKEECLDLPPKVYTRRIVEMTEEQERMYGEIREFALTEMEGGMVSATQVIVQIVRLQQMLCGHVRLDSGELVEVPTNRVDVLMEVLGETDGKVIVWSRFRHDIGRIVERIQTDYGLGSVAQFHGGNVDVRHLEADRFVSDPECRFMVASYAGGHGNTWTVADTVVYYSNDYDLEKRAQSEDRAHRAGQRAERVLYVDLCTPGTVDEKVIEALRKKITLASTITGDTYREWLV